MQPMTKSLRWSLALSLALAFGVLAAFLLARAPLWYAEIRAGGLSSPDAYFWMLGVGLLLSGLWRFQAQQGRAEALWPIWLAMGAFLIYAEVFNVVPLKRMACGALRTPRGAHHAAICDRYSPAPGA